MPPAYHNTTVRVREDGASCSTKAQLSSASLLKLIGSRHLQFAYLGDSGWKLGRTVPPASSRRAAEQGVEIVFLWHKGCLDATDPCDTGKRTSLIRNTAQYLARYGSEPDASTGIHKIRSPNCSAETRLLPTMERNRHLRVRHQNKGHDIQLI